MKSHTFALLGPNDLLQLLTGAEVGGVKISPNIPSSEMVKIALEADRLNREMQ